MYDVIIRNGSVVLDTGILHAEIGIQNGSIAEVAPSISQTAAEEVDASGMYVFPGAIDVHVHLDEPGRTHWEGFKTGAEMLAAGGVTTFVDMPLNGIPSTTTKDALVTKAQLGMEKSIIDFGLWAGLVPGNTHELSALAEAGCLGFKAFLSPTGNKEFESVNDEELLLGMSHIAGLGKVLALHAESGPMTTFLTNQKRQHQQVTADDYLESRPIAAEVEAVERALHYASITGCPLHFVHISSVEAVAVIEGAKQKGMDVTLETCPHYLLFSHQDLHEKGNLAKCAPPLRHISDHKKLRAAMKMGRVDFLTSDHSPCDPELKDEENYSLFEAWGGINGGGCTLLAALQFALDEEIDLHHVAQWTAKKPAERFGLADRKGDIAEGKDADLVMVSMNQHVVTLDNYYAKHPLSLYTGKQFSTRVEQVFSSGQRVFTRQDGPIHSRTGQWLKSLELAKNEV
ncbi:allantoinase AllB [Alkalicoccobacillus porphyridii]|nr:allantoinase AllB [Alkalicoccobacillus porphyridii]